MTRSLNVSELRRTIGIACSQAGGIKANFGTATKPYHVGRTAQCGVEAAHLSAGMTANKDALEREFGGYLDLFGASEADAMAVELGPDREDWLSFDPPVAFKPYPCCGSSYAPINAALAVREALGSEPEDLDRVEVVEHPQRIPHTDRPDPQTANDTKFSVQYCTSLALSRGNVWLDDFESDAVADPERHRYLDAVDVRGDTSYPEWGTTVRITDANGRSVERSVEAPLGSASRPLSNDELNEKFRRCAEPSLSAAAAEKAISMLRSIEALDNVEALADVLVPNRTRGPKTVVRSLGFRLFSAHLRDMTYKSSLQESIRGTLVRSGTSRGLFVCEGRIPESDPERTALILELFGSPDPLQLDGVGGSHSHTSKLMIIGPGRYEGVDLRYTFGQVGVETASVDFGSNCGNLTSAIGVYGILEGLVKPTEPVTELCLYNTNTDTIVTQNVPVVDGELKIQGDYEIDGVPGSGARIDSKFHAPGGGVTGLLLPTGRRVDEFKVDGEKVSGSIVDAANPNVFVRADDIGMAGTELPTDIEADADLQRRLERICSLACARIGLVDDPDEATERSPGVPYIAVVTPPQTVETEDPLMYTTSPPVCSTRLVDSAS